MVATPPDLDERAARADPSGEWVVPDVVFVGSLQRSAATLPGELAGSAGDRGWIIRTGRDGEPELLELREVDTAAGRQAWVVAGRTRGDRCPASELETTP